MKCQAVISLDQQVPLKFPSRTSGWEKGCTEAQKIGSQSHSRHR